MRLIDADVLYRLYSLNAKGEHIPEKDCDNFPITVSIADIRKAIRNAPTVDTAQVIHCKDCTHRDTDSCPMSEEYAGVLIIPSFLRDDDFCSHGEEAGAK